MSFAEGARLEIMHNAARKAVAEPMALGYHQLAVSVGSKEAVDAKTNQLFAAGYDCVSMPRTTGDGYYESVIVDVEGNQIEITV
ncbi:hypothetical protein UL82_09730 [Corynebacterium kutscheri]|uniref:VOC domain-containing protein n=1 Tax=Corynebacterium kutscheri TaxID=35755 RepID=A0A0F6R372_9CORY|nr:VOC family protein [Corynebacterium kutscheri]AKE42083.1 hypothetical protein UL82_09730 [Corynebacterium kutscheri]VEH10425.1 Uncharacterised protein [Corynebacterium kutscheri]